MGSQKLGGIILCGATVLLAAVFLVGLVLQSYWALAIPVAVMTLIALALIFWVGWTMVVSGIQPSSPLPGEREQQETPS